MDPAEQAELLDSLLSSSTEYSIIAADMDGRIIAWNEGARRLYGYDAGEVIGKDVAVLHAADSVHAGRPEEIRRAARETGTWSGELQRQRKDGSEFTALVTLTLRKDGSGKPSGYTLISRDVTESHRLHTELAESQDFQKRAIDLSPHGVILVDPAGRMVRVNLQTCAVFGYAESELLGQPVEMLLPQALRSPHSARHSAYRRSPSARPMGHGRELKGLRKDGREILVEVGLAPIDRGGETYVIATVIDVTQQRSLEQQLRQAQRMESIGRLAGGVAHDFNNILTAIFGYTALMLERFAAGSDEHEDLTEIQKAAQRASSLTRQLLAFSRQQVLQPVVLNPNEVIENLQKMLGRIVGEDVSLRIAVGRAVGNFKADPGQIEQVLMNLVVNARDAMPDGGSLLIETSNTDLDEQYAEDHSPVVPGPYVLLAVSDTGVGIPPQVKARIFEPFFTTKELGKGTGLGLSTVYGIVKQSGGYIWVYSEVGKGTTFKLYFPRVDAPVAGAASAPRPEQLSGTETILLAEDDETLRTLTRGTLSRLGYQVLDAASAAEALERASRHDGEIHLLLTDVVMPGGSGRELARSIAASRPGTKVLFMSGYTGEAMVHHGLSEPGLNYLQKPYTPHALALRVREVLSQG